MSEKYIIKVYRTHLLLDGFTGELVLQDEMNERTGAFQSVLTAGLHHLHYPPPYEFW